MARRSVQALDGPTVGALLSPAARARTTGTLVWTDQGVVKVGRVTVDSDLLHVGSGELRIAHRPVVAPSQPKMQYLVAGRSIRRLCVNEPHRPFEGTHKHKLGPFASEEEAYEPDGFPMVPLAPRIAPGVLQAVFEAFAAECSIDLRDPYRWQEPGGRT